MTRTSDQLLALLNNFSVIDAGPIAQAMQGTVVFSNDQGQNQTGFALTYNSVTYLVTTGDSHSIESINNVTNYSNVTATPQLIDSTQNVQVYSLPNNFAVTPFIFDADVILEGLEVYAIGNQMTQAFLSSGGSTGQSAMLNLNFSVSEGVISRINSPLNPSFGGYDADTGPYLRHTGIINPYGACDCGGSFGGPLFSIQAVTTNNGVTKTPVLVGMNVRTYYENSQNPAYLGISFALPKQPILAALTSIVGN